VNRILIDGAILIAIMGPYLMGTLAINPRIALSDYPPDVQAAVPPRTRRELALGFALGIPFLILMVGVPLYSAFTLRGQLGGSIPYWAALVDILALAMIGNLFDLVVLDILIFSLWTPKFIVIPGTEGMAGYKDISFHLKAHLRGTLGLIVLSALLALIPALVGG
jgi:hypothetical protein